MTPILRHHAADTRHLSLRWRWHRAVNRLLLVMLLGGIGSLTGTVLLVTHISGTAHEVEAEASALADLRAEVVARTIALSTVSQRPTPDVREVEAFRAAVLRSFERANEGTSSDEVRQLLAQARATWLGATARIRAMIAASTPAPTPALAVEVGQVLSTQAPIVLGQLERAAAAGLVEARANMERDRVTIAAAVSGLVLLTVLGLVMVRRLGRRLEAEVLIPVGTLRESADMLASGDLSHRVSLPVGDEIGSLAASFNEMADAIAGSQQVLTLQANHDSLTGLANRAGFRTAVEAALARPHRRQGSQAVLFVDLDDFKDVNDLLGHGAGDELLRLVSSRLEAAVRPSDLVARLGGDEFAVHLDQVPSPKEAYELAQRLVDAVSEPATIQGHVVQIGASIGLAIVPVGADLDQVMQEADMAMYSAKGQGKNRVECYDAALHLAVVEHHGLKADLAHAVERGELVLHYQPIVDLTTGALTGVEALVRWQHPTRGLLPPSAFIELAEQTGAMRGIGRWVLDQAVSQMDSWQRRYDLPNLGLAVNVSAVQLADQGFVTSVSDVLSATHMRPGTLTLEVTESVLVDEHGPVPVALHALRALGAQVAIDDFGTGFASMNHLKILPADVLKIDRSFIVAARDGLRGQALLAGLIDLGAHLGCQVIPEGIELAQDLGRLQRLGCSDGQGFLLSRPLEVEAVEQLLASPTQAVSLELGLTAVAAEPTLPSPRSAASDTAAELNC